MFDSIIAQKFVNVNIFLIRWDCFGIEFSRPFFNKQICMCLLRKIKCSITFQIDSGHIENKGLIMSTYIVCWDIYDIFFQLCPTYHRHRDICSPCEICKIYYRIYDKQVM